MRRSLRGFAVTQPDVTGGAILREILPRVRGIELPPVLRAVTHVAHGRQLDTGIRRRYSDVLVASHAGRALTLRRRQRNAEAVGLHAYRVSCTHG